MGMHPRWIKSDTVYSQTQRTVDRQFLFKPEPAIKNIIGASAARAQQTNPVKIYWLESNINHEHIGIAALSNSPKDINNLVIFKQTFHRIMADELNKYHDRGGAVFSTPAHVTECIDNKSLEQQFFYALTNPVKDGLVDRVSHWEGFSSYKAFAHGKIDEFTYFDRTAWHRSGGVNSKKKIQQFAKKISIKYSPLPAFEAMLPAKRQAYIRREIKTLEQHFRETRAAKGLSVIGKNKLRKIDPRQRPKTNPKQTPKPLCHSSTLEAAKKYKQEFRDFLNEYIIASAAYRAGFFDTIFPKGSIKPPLLEVCT